jgi:hypothetical protein
MFQAIKGYITSECNRPIERLLQIFDSLSKNLEGLEEQENKQ